MNCFVNIMCVSAAGVAYCNPPHLLDAAQYVELAWDAVSDAKITVRMRLTSLSY